MNGSRDCHTKSERGEILYDDCLHVESEKT